MCLTDFSFRPVNRDHMIVSQKKIPKTQPDSNGFISAGRQNLKENTLGEYNHNFTLKTSYLKWKFILKPDNL